MSFLLNCPNCGPRDVQEFRYGGQIFPAATPEVLSASNLPGPQRERWYHRFGCRCWMVAERDVSTNLLLGTSQLEGQAP